MNYRELVAQAESELKINFEECEKMSLINQEKVLDSFISNRVSPNHFSGTTGYGYGDSGREMLGKIFAKTFAAEQALVSPHFASGTHAITTALFGLLKPGDRAVCLTGIPYDTLKTAIFGSNIGSLSDYKIDFDVIPLSNGYIDLNKTISALSKSCELIYMQRSAGYERRKSFSIAQLSEIIITIRKYSNAPIVIDNCYGEFTEILEPTNIGADVIIGSLIKNPGGAVAPSGGYIAGKAIYIDKISMRFTAPGLGNEIGSYESTYRPFFQGFFLAPHVVCQAKKGGLLIASVMEKLGYTVHPSSSDNNSDIVKVIDFNDKKKMISFCRSIQSASPIESYAAPEPWAMPGYDTDVIMASGSFIQGSSIELSADAPVKPPYSLYIQGGITYEHTKIALIRCLESINE